MAKSFPLNQLLVKGWQVLGLGWREWPTRSPLLRPRAWRSQRHPPDSLRAPYTPPLPPPVTQDVENPASKRGPGTRTPVRAPPAQSVSLKCGKSFIPWGLLSLLVNVKSTPTHTASDPLHLLPGPRGQGVQPGPAPIPWEATCTQQEGVDTAVVTRPTTPSATDYDEATGDATTMSHLYPWGRCQL